MFLYSHLFGPFIGNTVPLAFYLLSPKPGADIAILAASITAFWIYPFVLRATGRYNLLTVLSVENLIFSILWSCYFHGGVMSPTLPWTLTIPLLAFFYIGPSPRMRTIILSQLAINLAIFYYLYQTTSPPNGGNVGSGDAGSRTRFDNCGVALRNDDGAVLRQCARVPGGIGRRDATASNHRQRVAARDGGRQTRERRQERIRRQDEPRTPDPAQRRNRLQRDAARRRNRRTRRCGRLRSEKNSRSGPPSPQAGQRGA